MPSIRVHAWGGLGSQLFAVALIYDLKRRFPKRRIILVLHEGGVTKRISEIDALFTFIKKKKISDNVVSESKFDLQSSGIPVQFEKERVRNSKIRNLLLLFGFLSLANTNEEFSRIRFWVVTIRGHYSYRTLCKPTINQIYSEIQIASDTPPELKKLRDSVALHFRLGDLTKLSSKSPIEEKKLKKILSSLKEHQNLNCILFSDSPKLASKLLTGAWNEKKIISVDVDSVKMLWLASNSKIFIGTNSKLSMWAALFKILENVNSTIYMPKTLMINFENLLATELTVSNRNYY